MSDSVNSGPSIPQQDVQAEQTSANPAEIAGCEGMPLENGAQATLQTVASNSLQSDNGDDTAAIATASSTTQSALHTVISESDLGANHLHEVVRGETIELDGASFSNARFLLVEEGLLIELSTGQLVFLEGFHEGGEALEGVFLSVDGRDPWPAGNVIETLSIPSGELENFAFDFGNEQDTSETFNASKATADNQALDGNLDVEPTAGVQSAGGGAGFGRFDAGNIGDGLTPLGPLDPTTLAYGAPDALPESGGFLASNLAAQNENVDVSTPASSNKPPVATPDNAFTQINTPVSFQSDVLSRDDIDPDGDPLTVLSVQNPQSGSVVMDANGLVTFTPADGFKGSTSFTYTVSDGNGGIATGIVKVHVADGEQPPEATNDNAVTDRNVAVSFDRSVLSNDDFDPNGDVLTVVSVQDAQNGTVAMDANGLVTFTPDQDFVGSTYFTYTITDGNGGFDTAKVFVTVNDTNTAPIATIDNAVTDEGVPVSFDKSVLSRDDFDADGDTLTVISVQDAQNGTVDMAADGTVTFTPDNGFTGDTYFTYTVSDGRGGTDTARVNVRVEGQNTAPVATPDNAVTEQGVPVSFNKSVLSRDDFDADGDTLTVTSVQDAQNGTVVMAADGTVTFTPDAGFVGRTSFTYTVSDGRGGTDTTEVFVTVNSGSQGPANNPPLSEPDKVVILHDRMDSRTMNNHAGTDPDGDTLTYTLGTLPPSSMGTMTIGKDGTPVTSGQQLTEAEYIDLHFQPVTGAAGSSFNFHYTVDDGKGGSDGGVIEIRLIDATKDPQVGGGTDGNDVVSGTYDDDHITGGIGNDFLKSGAGDDTLDGGEGNDEIYGGGGNDTSIGGAGEDIISSGDDDDLIIDALEGLDDPNSHARIAGGPGTDTLELPGHNVAIDLTMIDDDRITGIEKIDLGGGGNSVTLDIDEILNISNTTDTLIVEGENGDAIVADLSGAVTSSSQPGYTTYMVGGATLVVENTVDQSAIIT